MTASDPAPSGLIDDSAGALDRTGADISIPTDSPLGAEESDDGSENDGADVILEDEPLYTDDPDDPVAAEDTLAADPMADIRPGHSGDEVADPDGDGLAAKLDVDPDRDGVKG